MNIIIYTIQYALKNLLIYFYIDRFLGFKFTEPETESVKIEETKPQEPKPQPPKTVTKPEPQPEPKKKINLFDLPVAKLQEILKDEKEKLHDLKRNVRYDILNMMNVMAKQIETNNKERKALCLHMDNLICQTLNDDNLTSLEYEKKAIRQLQLSRNSTELYRMDLIEKENHINEEMLKQIESVIDRNFRIRKIKDALKTKVSISKKSLF